MKKHLPIASVLLILLSSTTLIASADVTATEVEIRGDVSQLSFGNFSVDTWDATNFAGFWYDIDENRTTEKLSILKFKDSRTIDKDDLQYTTTRAPQRYEVFKEKNLTVEHGLDLNLNKASSPARGGYYALVGWMAEKYVGVNGKNNKLSKLILEQGATDKKTLQVGETWDLGGGYTLTAQSIDAKATPRQAWLVLSKDGNKLDDQVIQQNQVYTYSTTLAGETDVPVFVTYVDSVFAGQTSDMVQLKYSWVISDQVTEIKSGDKYGIFDVNTETPLSLSNDGSLSLSRNSEISLAGNMKFKVADSDDNDVRFYPFVDVYTPGPVEVRGSVSQSMGVGNVGVDFSVKNWNARNFAGFWYDIDDNKSTESLSIAKFVNTRTIDKDDLSYTTARASQKYKVFSEANQTVNDGLDSIMNKPSAPAKGGYYALVGWMAQKYVAVNGKNNKLSKLILEQGATDKQTLQVGGTWDLGGGYTLVAQSIDAKATPRQAWLVLSKDGNKIDDQVVQQNQVYTYTVKSLAGESDVPVFVTYVDSVFAGATSDMVQLKYTWLISDQVTEVKSGDKFGLLEVDTESPLVLKNSASLSLSRDSTLSIAGEMKFKIADSEDNDVRFYPKVDYQIGNAAPTPTVTMTIPGVTTPSVTMPTTTIIGTGTATPPPTESVTVTTPVATTKAPGFEAIAAIVGMLAVVYLVLRQRKIEK